MMPCLLAVTLIMGSVDRRAPNHIFQISWTESSKFHSVHCRKPISVCNSPLRSNIWPALVAVTRNWRIINQPAHRWSKLNNLQLSNTWHSIIDLWSSQSSAGVPRRPVLSHWLKIAPRSAFNFGTATQVSKPGQILDCKLYIIHIIRLNFSVPFSQTARPVSLTRLVEYSSPRFLSRNFLLQTKNSALRLHRHLEQMLVGSPDQGL